MANDLDPGDPPLVTGKINHHIRIDTDGELDTMVMQRVWETRDLLGAPLFNAMLRGLALSDRLNTSGQLILRIGAALAGTPAAHPPLSPKGDEMQMLFWATTAWMREFSNVVDAMVKAGIEGLLRFSPATLVELRAVTARWKTEIFAQMRNQVGVHIDPRVIERGLRLCRVGGDTSIQLLVARWEGHEGSSVDTNIRAVFAHAVLYAGLFAPAWTGEDVEAPIGAEEAQAIAAEATVKLSETVSQTAHDHGSLPGLMRSLVIECAKALHFGERPVPIAAAPQTKKPAYKAINDQVRQELDVTGRSIEGWDPKQDLVAKVVRVREEMNRLRSEKNALRAELRAATRKPAAVGRAGPGATAPGP